MSCLGVSRVCASTLLQHFILMYLFNCVRLPRAKALLTSVFVVLAAALSYAAEPSGALPLLHIDTENGAAITSKEDYVNASLYLDANGVSGVEPVGSADAPVSLKIKGRGNYTWTGFDKKPYRLKFDKKVSILGMKKNKHFGLLAHADDNLGFCATPWVSNSAVNLGWRGLRRPSRLKFYSTANRSVCISSPS